jgi:hypothetical protein
MKRLLVLAAAISLASCATATKTPPPKSVPTTGTPVAAAPAAPTPAAKPAPGARPVAATPPVPAAQAPAPRPADQQPPADAAAAQARPGAAREEGPPEPKPYDRVITKDAKSDEGVFTVHRIKEKVFYEIPKKELGKEFLWVTQIAKTTMGVGYGGQALGNRVVKWERRDNRVLLRSVSYQVVADPSLPVARAVQAANTDVIIMAFNVEAVGKDEAPVIDVT